MLTEIKGIGASTQKKLNTLGIYEIVDLAMTKATDEVEQSWIEQAKSLMESGAGLEKSSDVNAVQADAIANLEKESKPSTASSEKEVSQTDIATIAESKQSKKSQAATESKGQTNSSKSTSDDSKTFKFKFLLGLFKNQPFSWNTDHPAFKVRNTLYSISMATLEEVDDPKEEGQKFKLNYAGEWSSAVLPKGEYKDFKIAVNSIAPQAAARRMNYGSNHSGGMHSSNFHSAAKGGCCGG